MIVKIDQQGAKKENAEFTLSGDGMEELTGLISRIHENNGDAVVFQTDAMNLGKHTWYSPFLPDASSDRSVPELFDEAKRYATALFDAYRSGDRAALMDLLKNRTMQKGATV